MCRGATAAVVLIAPRPNAAAAKAIAGNGKRIRDCFVRSTAIYLNSKDKAMSAVRIEGKLDGRGARMDHLLMSPIDA